MEGTEARTLRAPEAASRNAPEAAGNAPEAAGNAPEAAGNAPEAAWNASEAASRNAPGELRGLLEMIGAMALGGSSVVAGKVLSARMPVFLATELGLCAALLAILPVQALKVRELLSLRGRDLLWMFLQALFGMVLFRVFTLYGLRLTTASAAGLITSAGPVVLTVFAALVLKERLGRRGVLAACLATGGLVLIQLGHGAPGDAGRLAGNLLVLAATVCEALLTVFRKSSGGRIGAVTNTTLLVSMSALMLLPFALRDLAEFPLSRVDPACWAAAAYHGAVATSVAYILWGDGSVRIPASRTGIAMAAMPLAAVALSALVLGEGLSPLHLAGGAAVILAVVAGRK